MTSTFDRARFLKLIALTESANDAEALAALRKASEMARASGMTLSEAAASPGGFNPDGPSQEWLNGYEAGEARGRREARIEWADRRRDKFLGRRKGRGWWLWDNVAEKILSAAYALSPDERSRVAAMLADPDTYTAFREWESGRSLNCLSTSDGNR
jgi:hypothetical protein